MNRQEAYIESRLRRLDEIRNGDDLELEVQTTQPLVSPKPEIRQGWHRVYFQKEGRTFRIDVRSNRILLWGLRVKRPTEIATFDYYSITKSALPANCNPDTALHVRGLLGHLAAHWKRTLKGYE